jgi:hypothetical protein
MLSREIIVRLLRCLSWGVSNKCIVLIAYCVSVTGLVLDSNGRTRCLFHTYCWRFAGHLVERNRH